jgi:hypothetical protein
MQHTYEEGEQDLPEQQPDNRISSQLKNEQESSWWGAVHSKQQARYIHMKKGSSGRPSLQVLQHQATRQQD